MCLMGDVWNLEALGFCGGPQRSPQLQTFHSEGLRAELVPRKPSVAVQGPSLSQPITDGMRWGYMDLAGLRKAQAMSQLAPWKSHICLLGSHLNIISVQSPS